MKKNNYKKRLFFLFSFFCFLGFLGLTISNASTISNEEYLKEIEKIKALSPAEGYEAWVELHRVPKIHVNVSDDTGLFFDNTGKTFNKGKIDYESWFDDEGNEYEGKQKNSFQYYGADADCSLLDGGEKIACQSKHLFWNKGTLKMAGSLVIEGFGLAMNSFDSAGMHWIMTGVYEPLYNALGFDTVNKKLVFGNDVFVEKNLMMGGSSNSLFLKGDNSSEKFSQSGNDITVSSGGGYLTVSDDVKESRNTNYNLLENEDYHYMKWKVRSIGGLEVENFTRTEEVLYQQGLLLYCMPTLDYDERPLYQACEIEEDSERMHSDNFIYKLIEPIYPPLPEPAGCSVTPAIADPGCTPNCGTRECGSYDGCGGSCGTCPSGETCEGGYCTGYVWGKKYVHFSTSVNTNIPDCPGGDYGVTLGSSCNKGEDHKYKCIDQIYTNALGQEFYKVEAAGCVKE